MQFFIAAPSDLNDELDAVRETVEQFNRGHDLQPGSFFHIDVVDWHGHVAPHLERTQKLIIRDLPIDPWDFFLGIAWLQFDPPEHPLDSSGATENEFGLAFNFWQETNRLPPLFYRCMRLPSGPAAVDSKRLEQVTTFFSRFETDEPWAGTAREYFTLDSFHELLTSDLEQRLELARTGTGHQPAPAVAPTPTVATSASGSGDRLETGSAYEVVLLNIELANLEQFKDEPSEAFDTAASSLRQLVEDTASQFGGRVLSWKQTGGLLLFWDNQCGDRAAITGLKLIHNLPILNLDPEQNPLSQPIGIKAAAHDAVVVFQLPTEDIQSTDIDWLSSLQESADQEGQLTISKRLLEKLDQRLKSRFRHLGRFSGELVYGTQLPAAAGDFQDQLVRLTSDAREQRSRLMDLTDDDSSAELAALSSGVDEFYSTLNRFSSTFSRVDDEWSADLIANIASGSRELLEHEDTLWQHLRDLHRSHRKSGSGRLGAIVQAAARRRSRPVVILGKIELRCGGSSRSEEASAQPKDDVIGRVGDFLRADELDSETALTLLLLNDRAGLLEHLIDSKDDDTQRPLLDKLWSRADTVLLDDLYSLRGHRRAEDAKFFASLTDKIGDSRFGLVQELLAQDNIVEAGQVEQRMTDAGLPSSGADGQIVWRCLVVGHSAPEARRVSATNLTLDSIWRVISHPSIPIPTVRAIGEQLHSLGSEDAEKIFFDCTRSVIDNAAESFKTSQQLNELTNLIELLFEFSFLVESGYFERFDDILRKLLARANQAELQVDYFERLRTTLEQSFEEGGRRKGKPPAGIKKLPLTLQRRLASEPQYVYWFVSHPDPRIARETLRHIGLMNIERVLRLREVNQAVLSSLLRKPELFTRLQPLIAALNHPKCTQTFAAKHLSTLGRSRQGVQSLEKLMRNPSANPAIRGAAKRALPKGQR